VGINPGTAEVLIDFFSAALSSARIWASSGSLPQSEVLRHRRWPDPYSPVFGYHEVFHAYVGAATACQ